jgi:Zn finger protein HypA/HybF involved in hydrogenase expression
MIQGVWRRGSRGNMHLPETPHIPEVPDSILCEQCGSNATVMRQQTRQGKQLVIMRTDKGLYVQIDCPNCGRRSQAIDTRQEP